MLKPLVGWLLATALLCAARTEAKVIFAGFGDVVRESSVIARVRIEASRDAQYVIHGETRSCGHVFQAIVIESLKGGRGMINFVTPAHTSLRIGSEYLVFLRTYTAENRNGLDRETMSEDEAAYLDCRVGASDLVATEQEPVSVTPFDEGGANAPRRYLKDVRGTIIAHLHDDDGRVPWDRAKRAILEEIDNPQPEPPNG